LNAGGKGLITFVISVGKKIRRGGARATVDAAIFPKNGKKRPEAFFRGKKAKKIGGLVPNPHTRNYQTTRNTEMKKDATKEKG